MTRGHCGRSTCDAQRYDTAVALLDCERARSAGLETEIERHRARLAELLSSPDCPTPANMAMDILVEAAGAAKAKAAFMSGAVVKMRDELAAARADAAQARSAVLRTGRDPKFAAVYAWLDDHKDAMVKRLSDETGRWEREVTIARAEASAEAANGAALRTALQRLVIVADESDAAMRRGASNAEYLAIGREDTAALQAARTLLALPASESGARVQALVEAAREYVTAREAWLGSDDEQAEEDGRLRRVHEDAREKLIASSAALDAFAGHANKGDSNGERETPVSDPETRLMVDLRRKITGLVRNLSFDDLLLVARIVSRICRAAGKSWEVIGAVTRECGCSATATERYVIGECDPDGLGPEGWTRDGEWWRCPTCTSMEES